MLKHNSKALAAKRSPKRAFSTKAKKAGKKQSVLKQSKRKISFLDCFTGNSGEQKVGLDLVYPGVSLPSAQEALFKIGEPQISTLSNGIKVITSRSSIPVSHITLSINAGSRYEMTELNETGLTHFMERAILRSTTNRVTGTLVRDMAKMGADLTASAGRENFMITASTPTRINPVLGAVADIAKHAAFELQDMLQDTGYYLEDNHHRSRDDSSTLLEETLHLAAFGTGGGICPEQGHALPGASLGNPLYMPTHAIDQLQPKHLQRMHKKFFTADRMTLGAVGVEHNSFVALAEEMFGGIKAATPEEAAQIPTLQTNYAAGNLRILDHHHSDSNTTVALAWNAPSLVSPHLAAASVLQTVLGGGASFSSGGPGKGMYSRFYRNILQQHDWVNSVDSFYTTYTDAGLLGMYGTVPADSVAEYVDVVLEEMASLPAQISDEEVSRGKNMLKSQLFGHIADGAQRCEEMTRNVQIFGKNQLPVFFDQIDAVSTKDVREIADMVLKQDITVATFGDASKLQREITM